MKRLFIILGVMLFSPLAVFAVEEVASPLLFEDFSRFDAGTKPASYGGRAEIIREDGRNILRLEKGDVINNTSYFDGGGSNYVLRIRFRFLEDGKKSGGLVIRFNEGGRRGDYPYELYTLKLDSGALGIACVRGKKNKEPDRRQLKGVLFESAGIPYLKNNVWYELELQVRPDNVEVWSDIGGKRAKLISGKINYGTGRYTITSSNPLDVDYVTVSYLGGSDDNPALKAENTAGATNAVDQAEATKDK